MGPLAPSKEEPPGPSKGMEGQIRAILGYVLGVSLALRVLMRS